MAPLEHECSPMIRHKLKIECQKRLSVDKKNLDYNLKMGIQKKISLFLSVFNEIVFLLLLRFINFVENILECFEFIAFIANDGSI